MFHFIKCLPIFLCLVSCQRLLNTEFPDSFPSLTEPSTNPSTPEGIALGRRLFHETLLSSDGSISCASCHQQGFAFGDNSAVSAGVAGALGDRNANPLINLAWGKSFFWDGRAASLEEQALGPIENPLEMNETLENVVAKLQAESDYPGLFQAAFGSDTVTSENIGKAIAQFERTLVSSNSVYDQFEAGTATLTASQERGRDLFFSNRTNCSSCHSTITFTDGEFHDIGLDTNPQDGGRGDVTGNESDIGKFKTPTLRNVEFTGPYMHDGRFATLREVLDHYDRRIRNSPNVSGRLNNLRRNGLRREEKDDLIAFLLLLSDDEFVSESESQ